MIYKGIHIERLILRSLTNFQSIRSEIIDYLNYKDFPKLNTPIKDNYSKHNITHILSNQPTNKSSLNKYNEICKIQHIRNNYKLTILNPLSSLFVKLHRRDNLTILLYYLFTYKDHQENNKESTYNLFLQLLSFDESSLINKFQYDSVKNPLVTSFSILQLINLDVEYFINKILHFSKDSNEEHLNTIVNQTIKVLPYSVIKDEVRTKILLELNKLNLRPQTKARITFLLSDDESFKELYLKCEKNKDLSTIGVCVFLKLYLQVRYLKIILLNTNNFVKKNLQMEFPGKTPFIH